MRERNLPLVGEAQVASAIAGVQGRSFAVFFSSYTLISLLAGMGNGSTYKMIPSIFRALGEKEAAKRPGP